MQTQLPLHSIAPVVYGYHENPFEVLGPHEVEQNGRRALAVRAYLPEAQRAWVVDPAHGVTRPMRRIHPAGLYEAVCSMEEANNLAIVLRAGAMPAPLKIIQDLTVGPSLGRDSIEKGVHATLFAGLLVVVFMAIYYRLSGVIADFALLLNLICLIGSLAALNATLTLPGIAGIILTIGMGVDSNVLIFERIREELRQGKPVRLAIDGGYDKALLTIVDSHVTTLITGFALFLFGTGPIKGFAVTLCLGITINLFTALVGTKVVFDLLNQRKKIEQLSI